MGTTLAPAYTARRGQSLVLRSLIKSQALLLTWLCVEAGVVVLVPVLERRASVEFRHGHLPAVLLTARLELFRPGLPRTESEQSPPYGLRVLRT
jgi:hypothetical protein